jgi:2-polyprenyl-6-methoxyphenol hydroxylase-like FAD-dependent oxidoreductase
MPMVGGNPGKRVLISGASIAGPALAWWLMRHGFEPTLVEQSPIPRPGGHAIDVRGAALDVLRAMGLEARAKERRTQIHGMSVLAADGSEVWRSEEMTISGGAFDVESIEILRDDTSEILLSALPDITEVMYGDSVVGLEDNGVDVMVSFSRAPSRSFDLVVGADGIGSNIRKLVFGDDLDWFHPFGVALASYSAPNHLELENWQVSYELGKERCLIYTARQNRELRLCFAFAAALAEVPRERAEQMALIKVRCGQWGWEVPQLLAAMESAPDFYLGPIAQIRAPTWSNGRVALVGDAAYCPSPFTGQGTSLALVGAYVLASELSQSPDDHAAAFARYEAKMRPFVEKNQALAEFGLDERFADPDFYTGVLEPALYEAQDAIELDGL